MRWKTLIAVFFLIALEVATASATEDTSIVITPLQDRISFGESALFQLRVTNSARYTQRYSIYSLQSRGWNVDPQPLSDKVIILLPGHSYTTKIRAQPTAKLEPGIYSVELTIDSDYSGHYEKFLKVYLGPEKPIQYLPVIKATLDLDDVINPKDTVAATLFLQNQNALDLTGMIVKIQSAIPEFNQEIPVELPPLGEKTIEFTLKPSAYLQPKDYKLFFVFENKGETIKVLEKDITVITLVPEFAVDVDEDSFFLKTTSKVTVTNSGNVLNTQKVRVPVSLFASLFITSGGEFIVYGGQRYLVWEKSLKPGESAQVEFVTDYRLIFYVVFVVLLLAGFYAAVQPPAIIRKKAVTVRSSDSGGLSEIKVTLELKNKSRKQLRDLEVVDVVPAIANVEKSLELGTMKPKEIRQGKSGTKVLWLLPECEVHEQRIITYNIRAKLNILGTFRLPRAEVHYLKRNGKKGKAYSNLFDLTS